MPIYGSNFIIKFVDDDTVIGFINDNHETDCRAEVEHLAVWCAHSNPVTCSFIPARPRSSLLTSGKKTEKHTISSMSMGWLWNVSPASSFWGCSSQRTCSGQLTPPASSRLEAHQRLFFLRTLRKNNLSTAILGNFYCLNSFLPLCNYQLYQSFFFLYVLLDLKF